MTHPRHSSARHFRRDLDQDIGYAPVQFLFAVLSSLMWAGLCFLAATVSPPARAQQVTVGGVAAPADAVASPQAQAMDASSLAMQAQVENLLSQQPMPKGGDSTASHAKGGKNPWRIEVTLGQLDPRLRLAPCAKVHAYVPDGMQMWGRTRVGLRCEQGPVKWNVFWPVTVKVWGQALVAAGPLRQGATIGPEDVRPAEVDLAAKTSPALARVSEVVGRVAARNLESGQSLRQDDLKARRWFAAGDPVKLTVRGTGFQVAGEGTALTPGDEGQCARIRTEGGRVVCGQPVGERQVELSL